MLHICLFSAISNLVIEVICVVNVTTSLITKAMKSAFLHTEIWLGKIVKSSLHQHRGSMRISFQNTAPPMMKTLSSSLFTNWTSRFAACAKAALGVFAGATA